MSTTFSLASGQYPSEWDSMLNLSRSQIMGLARVNIFVSLAFLAFYCCLAVQFPSFGLAILCTILWTILGSGLRPYLEHAGTDSDRFSSSRSWISPVFDYLYAGINYHLAHHLSPGVPAYRIKEFQAWLEKNNHIPQGEALEIHTMGEAFQVLRTLPYGARDSFSNQSSSNTVIHFD